MPEGDPFEVLGLAPSADKTVVKAVYHTLSKKYHPDQGGDINEFKRIKSAYETIMNKEPFDEDTDQSKYTDGSQSSGGIFSNILGPDKPVETKSETGNPLHGIEVKGDYVVATIIGLFHDVDIQELVLDWDLEDRPGHHRTVILYDIENVSDQVLCWDSEESTYVGSDGYTYGYSEYRVMNPDIRPPWKGYMIDIEPNARTKFIEIVERMPKNVKVSRIIHTLDVYNKGLTSGWVEDIDRLEFVIDESDLAALDQPPSQLLE